MFRPDWEAVITPVLDFALTRPEIAPDRIALFGYSLGGYLVARAAAFDQRPAAVILDDGIYDFYAAIKNSVPPFLAQWIEDGRDDAALPVMAMLRSFNTQIRWAMRNGVWAMGVDSDAALAREFRRYTLDGIADQITSATLVLDAENDQFFKGQPAEVAEALTKAPTTYVALREAEGAGEHCHMGAMSRAHQTIFDWLDTQLAHGVSASTPTSVAR